MVDANIFSLISHHPKIKVAGLCVTRLIERYEYRGQLFHCILKVFAI